MILPKKVTVKWNGGTRKHYEDLGYEYTKKDEEFEVWAYELTPGSNIEVEFKCDYCGNIDKRRYMNLIEGRSIIKKDCCRDCTSKKHYESLLKKYGSLVSKYPEIAREWCQDRNDIKPDSVTPYSRKKVTWTCDKGHWWDTSIYSRTSGSMTGCPYCRKSKGERRVAESLRKLGIEYISEVSISDLIGVGGGLLKFDFAILDNRGFIKAFIEYDGEFHFESWYDGDGHETTVKHDKMKNDYCVRRKIPLYRIPYFEYERVSEIVDKICFEVFPKEQEVQ